MGSLSALMKMGLFEMRSGAEIEPKVDIGSPLFDKITIYLNSNLVNQGLKGSLVAGLYSFNAISYLPNLLSIRYVNLTFLPIT